MSVKVECNVYQSDHSYKGVSDKLLTDIENWIKKGITAANNGYT